MCDEAEKLGWWDLEGFYPQKTAGKVFSVTQSILKTSSIVDLIWYEGAGFGRPGLTR